MWVSHFKFGSTRIFNAQLRLSNIWSRPGYSIAYLSTTGGKYVEYKPIKSILVANRGKVLKYYI